MQKYGWNFPINVSTHGAGIDHLINVMHVFMAVLFFGWLIFLIYVLYRFRAGSKQAVQYKEKHFKAPTYIEVVIVLFEFLLLIAFSTPIWYKMKKTPVFDAATAVKMRVVAQQFVWNIHYPGVDGIFGKVDPKLMDSSNPLGLDLDDPHAKDDVTTINQLHIPVNTPVSVMLSSKDVIHSFGIPVMRVKNDAIPGYNVPVWFQATQEGEFEIACAQLCGLGHYRMRGFFVVESKDKFNAWLAEQAPKAV
jgi:cytochrome c oxidase subunit 2